MGSDVKITYINKSMNKDLPKIFIFTKNETPTFDALKDGVAYKVIEDVGRGSSCDFIFPIKTSVAATWDNGSCKTQELTAQIGEAYIVEKNNTGIVLKNNGPAKDTKSIDVINNIHVNNGISVNFYKKDGNESKKMITKDIVGYAQKATFVLHPKLYWGIASEIQEGELISSAVLDSDHFHEIDLENISKMTVSLNGNAKDGYEFKVESQE
ncbi:hypothetical protein PV797_01935 [Clostridiaceae bacterium M8S5]|nr:hypothetical protein PV797_01935 [Clostridiaceae bacterium M8S5]